MKIGYLNRQGNFIDVSNYGQICQHIIFCDSNNLNEDDLLENKGWVKLTSVFSNEYIYMFSYPLSKAQQKWLMDNNYKIELWDIGD